MRTWRKHLWFDRIVVLDDGGQVQCECRWYRRLYYLLTRQ